MLSEGIQCMRILHITDSHLMPTYDEKVLGLKTAYWLECVLNEAVQQHVPDLILATGDIAHTPSEICL